MPSIKHPPADPSAPGPTARLPNFCNLGITLRLLIIVNLLCLAAAVVRAEGPDALQQYLRISAFAQPSIILSMLLTCAFRRVLSRVSYWQGVALIFALEAAIGVASWYALNQLLVGSQPASFWQVMFFFAFATGVVLLYFDMRSRALSPALIEARLQALQARIRPHFLFNSINAVLSLIRAEPRRAERMLEDMSDLFRVLMADNRKLVPLADEIDLCRKYLEIESIRLGDRLMVKWNVDAMPKNAMVPPLILQPLVENAVYHGIEPREGSGTLSIDVVPKSDQVVIRLTNPFHSGSTHVSGNRMAIANIKERLQLHFDAEASLKADVSRDQYVVTITMPTEKQEV